MSDFKCYRCGASLQSEYPWCECADGQCIVHADCRDVLPVLGKVDLVLTDPPYGIGLEEHGRNGHDWRIAGDENQTLGNEVLRNCWQREWPQIAFSSPKAPWLEGYWRQWLVWDKGPAVGGGGDRATCWKFDWEIIQVRLMPKLNGKRDSSVLWFHIGQRDYHLHPCQKPVKLLHHLIGKASGEGSAVLDPFLGSGTTLRAAKDLGRHALGIEIEEMYCEIAAERLRQGVLEFTEAT